MSVLIQRSADSKNHPDGLVSAPQFSFLTVGASLAVTTPAAATTITAAGAWSNSRSSGVIVDATAGTVTITKAGLYRVNYCLSDITAVNNQVLTVQAFIGAVGQGGTCKVTQPATATQAIQLAGEALLSCAVGDVITLKVIASTGNFTTAAGAFNVMEV
jgi:hypothetical protein